MAISNNTKKKVLIALAIIAAISIGVIIFLVVSKIGVFENFAVSPIPSAILEATKPTVSLSRPTESLSRPTVSLSRPTVSLSRPTESLSRPTESLSRPTVSRRLPNSILLASLYYEKSGKPSIANKYWKRFIDDVKSGTIKSTRGGIPITYFNCAITDIVERRPSKGKYESKIMLKGETNNKYVDSMGTASWGIVNENVTNIIKNNITNKMLPKFYIFATYDADEKNKIVIGPDIFDKSNPNSQVILTFKSPKLKKIVEFDDEIVDLVDAVLSSDTKLI